ncbi:Anti-sigma-E factor ChrR [bacterium HR40]|nr:Anti-sigma-E factor ChrR [bacterium HR40]
MTSGVDLDDLLIAHAAGRLARPLALLVRCHLRLRAASRRQLRLLEHVAGLWFERLEPAPLDPDRRAALFARLDEPDDSLAMACDPPPRPAALPLPLDGLFWRPVGHGVAEAALPSASDDGLEARLLRLDPGCGPGRHRHAAREFVLVLEGCLRDEFGFYKKGDVVVCDARVEHEPVAEGPRPCLCLEVRERPTG